MNQSSEGKETDRQSIAKEARAKILEVFSDMKKSLGQTSASMAIIEEGQQRALKAIDEWEKDGDLKKFNKSLN